MPKQRIAPLALALVLALAHGAHAASLTPPNLVAASSLNNPDLLLVWPYAAGGPLEAMSWSVFKTQMATGLTGSFLAPANNLSDLGNPTIARTNLGLPIGTSGASVCLLNSACTWSALQTFAASTTGSASINIPQGTAPTSPNNGDIWTTSNGVFGRFAGATQQLAAVVTGTLTPTLAYGAPGTSSFSYTTQAGAYTCAGGLVAGYVYIAFTPTNGTASGDLQWTNPPYNIKVAAIAGTGRALGFSGPVDFGNGGWSSLSAAPYFLGPENNSGSVMGIATPVNNSIATTVSTSNSATGTSKTLFAFFTYQTSTGGC